MLPTILARIGLPILIELIAGALRGVKNPAAQTAAGALDDVGSALSGGLISDDQVAEANRHTEELTRLKMSENQTALSEINESLRAEVNSSDPYVRRMRPTFGYLMAFTWAAQMFGLAYVVIFETEKAAAVMAGMESLSTIWAVGLSVLGIYVYKRSEEKRGPVAPSTSLLDILRPKVSSGVPTPPRKPAYND